jgi:hypothetical protein
MNEQNQPVGLVLSDNALERLADYGSYMLGWNRLEFIGDCQDTDPDTMSSCWDVHDRWVQWRRDVSLIFDS